MTGNTAKNIVSKLLLLSIGRLRSTVLQVVYSLEYTLALSVCTILKTVSP